MRLSLASAEQRGPGRWLCRLEEKWRYIIMYDIALRVSREEGGVATAGSCTSRPGPQVTKKLRSCFGASAGESARASPEVPAEARTPTLPRTPRHGVSASRRRWLDGKFQSERAGVALQARGLAACLPRARDASRQRPSLNWLDIQKINSSQIRDLRAELRKSGQDKWSCRAERRLTARRLCVVLLLPFFFIFPRLRPRSFS